MTDFYANRDRIMWPVEVNSNNDEVQVVEDPGGENEATITATLTHTDQLSNDAKYFPMAGGSTVTGSQTSDFKIIDGNGQTLHIRYLYEEIVSQLRSASSSSGNGLNYRIGVTTPSGSDFSNTGIFLDHDGSMSIKLDFSGANNALDPRYFGWDEDGQDNSGIGPQGNSDTVTGPFTRWGVWFSEVTAHDKRQMGERTTFQSQSQRRYAKVWQWTTDERMREIEYIAVAGVHVWPDDRASRTAEADRGGLPEGDANNAWYHVWDKVGVDDNYLLIGHGDGTSGLGSTIFGTNPTESFEVAWPETEWLDQFAPQEDTDDQYAGERYRLVLPCAVSDPEDSTSEHYRH